MGGGGGGKTNAEPVKPTAAKGEVNLAAKETSVTW